VTIFPELLRSGCIPIIQFFEIVCTGIFTVCIPFGSRKGKKILHVSAGYNAVVDVLYGIWQVIDLRVHFLLNRHIHTYMKRICKAQKNKNSLSAAA